jgi:hypothetical protein
MSACRVPTHRDAWLTRTKARPDESGRGRLRVCATLSYTTIFGWMTATPMAFM